MTVQDDWKIPGRARSCAESGRPFEAGDRVVSDLIDRGDRFERIDRLEGVEAPADAPEIAVAVFVEHGLHGSSSAAPIAQRILARYFEKQAAAAEVSVASGSAAGDDVALD